jgi:hypothetical protein
MTRWPDPPPGFREISLRDLDPAEAERELDLRDERVTRRTAALLLGLDPEEKRAKHPVAAEFEAKPWQRIDEKLLGRYNQHPAGPYKFVAEDDYYDELEKLAANLSKLKAAGMESESLPFHVFRYEPNERRYRRSQEQSRPLPPGHVRKFADYLVYRRGGHPEHAFRPQKRGRGANPETRRIRAEVAWELNAVCGIPLRELAPIFGVGTKARMSQLVDEGAHGPPS